MKVDGCVTLEEILAAAASRLAALVPETSGYLALAIADATSRLPLDYDERGLMLTTEGSVTVMRRGPAVSAPEGARALRDLLSRLLAASAGTMPGLATAAKPRSESDRGVDAVVTELEAALIPVNRTAARRALARLARESLKAKESGKLRLRPAKQKATAKAKPAAIARRPATVPIGSAPEGHAPRAVRAPTAASGAWLPTLTSTRTEDEPIAVRASAVKSAAPEQAPERSWADDLHDPTPTVIGMVLPVEESPRVVYAAEKESVTSLEVKTGYGAWVLPTPPPPSTHPFAQALYVERAPPKVESCEIAPPVAVSTALQPPPFPVQAPPPAVPTAALQPPPFPVQAPPPAVPPASDDGGSRPQTPGEPRPQPDTIHAAVLAAAEERAVSQLAPRPSESPATHEPVVVDAAPESTIAEAGDAPPLSLLDAALQATAHRMAPAAGQVVQAWTRADDLLSSFGSSDAEDAGMRDTAASLKQLAGLDPTPAPSLAQRIDAMLSTESSAEPPAALFDVSPIPPVPHLPPSQVRTRHVDPNLFATIDRS